MRTARNGTHQGVHHRIHLRTNGQHGIHSASCPPMKRLAPVTRTVDGGMLPSAP